MFHGKPIIAYSIEAAKASGLFDDVYVSTDDESAIAIARYYRVGVIVRPEKLAADSVGTQAVMEHALRVLATVSKKVFDYACCIYPCAPLMTASDLNNGFVALAFHDAPYVYSVGEDGADAGQWYWGKVQSFLDGVPLTQGRSFSLPNKRVCDINVESDWLRAENLYEEMHKHVD